MRVISKKFVESLKGPMFSSLINEVAAKDSDIVMCFRGEVRYIGKNGKPKKINEYVSVYYKGHQLLKISNGKNQYNVVFNFNHAKYYSDWESMLNELHKMGFKLSVSKAAKLELKKQIEILRDRGFGKYPRTTPPEKGETAFVNLVLKNNQPAISWGELIKNLKDLMNSFFAPNQENAVKYDEKQDQMKLMLMNRNLENGYMFYDIEFQLTRGQSQVNGEKIPIPGQIDLVGVRFNRGKPMAIILTELKSTKEAVESGTTGIFNHYSDMKNYLSKSEEGETSSFLIDRKKEAISSLNNLIKLGIIKRTGYFEADSFDDVQIEFLFLFKDEAWKSSVIELFQAESKTCVPPVSCLKVSEDYIV